MRGDHNDEAAFIFVTRPLGRMTETIGESAAEITLVTVT
jgi:hypothetical protein